MTSDDKDHLMQDVGAAIASIADVLRGQGDIADALLSIADQIDRTGRRLEDTFREIAIALRELREP